MLAVLTSMVAYIFSGQYNASACLLQGLGSAVASIEAGVLMIMKKTDGILVQDLREQG